MWGVHSQCRFGWMAKGSQGALKMSWGSCLPAPHEGYSAAMPVAWVVEEKRPVTFFLWALWQFQEIVHLLPACPSALSQLEIHEQRA